MGNPESAPLVAVIKDFVEGRMTGSSFRDAINNEPAFADVLFDEAGQPHPWVREGTYVFVISQNFDDIYAASAAQSALSAWLERHGIAHERDTSRSELYGLLLGAQPSWLDVDGEYFNSLLQEAGGREGGDLKQWLKAELRRRFVSVKRPPKWIQNPAWPIGPNGPLVFLGQLSVGEYFHDAGFCYVFLDATDGHRETIIQLY